MKPYRPWSGTAGDIFEEAFCHKCKRNQEFEETEQNPCPIWMAAVFYEQADYPKEWVKDDNDKFDETARCTAFEPIT
jgi:hypothetical protein